MSKEDIFKLINNIPGWLEEVDSTIGITPAGKAKMIANLLNQSAKEIKQEKQTKQLETKPTQVKQQPIINQPIQQQRMTPENFNPNDIQKLIIAKAKQYGVDPALALAVAKNESGFNQNAKSPVGALGVMQLMPSTAKGLGVDPYNLEQNIDGGIRLLKQNMKTYGNSVNKTLAAYNAGPGAVAKYGGVPPYKETQNYINRIAGDIQNYRTALGGINGNTYVDTTNYNQQPTQGINQIPLEGSVRSVDYQSGPTISKDTIEALNSLLGTSNETQSQKQGGTMDYNQLGNILQILNAQQGGLRQGAAQEMPATPVTQEQVDAIANMVKQSALQSQQRNAQIDAITNQYLPQQQLNPNVQAGVNLANDIGQGINNLTRINHPVSMVGANGQVFTVGDHLANQDYKNAMIKQMSQANNQKQLETALALAKLKQDNSGETAKLAQQYQSALQLAQQTGLPLEMVMNMKGADWVNYIQNKNKAAQDISVEQAKGASDILKQWLANQGDVDVQGLKNTGDVDVENIKQSGENKRAYAKNLTDIDIAKLTGLTRKEVADIAANAQRDVADIKGQYDIQQQGMKQPTNDLNAINGLIEQMILSNDPRAKMMIQYAMGKYFPELGTAGGVIPETNTNPATLNELFKQYGGK